MCVVSMVTQHYYERFPLPQYFPPISWTELQELRRKAAIYDKEHGQEDCVDPKKDEWYESVKKLMENSKFGETKRHKSKDMRQEVYDVVLGKIDV